MIAVLGLFASAHAESPPAIVWTRILSTAADDYVNGIDVNAQGNIVAVGYSKGDLFRTRTGIWDAFAVSYNPAGERRWATQFGQQFRYTDLDDVTLGPNGDWFATGTVDYRRGSQQYGGTDVIVQRIGPTGSLGFVTQLGTSGSDNAQAITASSSQVFAAGDTYGTLSGTNAGGNDAFLTRYGITSNLTLEHNWSAQRGTDDWDVVRDTTYAGGRVFVAGETFGNFSGPNIDLTDAFLLSYDSDGNFQWARQYGQSDEPETAYAVATNGVDAVYIAGETFLGQSWQSGGTPDAFLAKYDLNGNFQWERFYESSVWDGHLSLDLDDGGNVYVGGYTGQLSDVPTESSLLLMKYSPDGDLIWSSEYDIDGNEKVYGLEVSPSGDKIWIAGTYWIGDTDAIVDGFMALLEQEGIVGDFNQDGAVDAADYVVWRKSGASAEQYNQWRANFGAIVQNEGALATNVPEPEMMSLLYLVAACRLSPRRR